MEKYASGTSMKTVIKSEVQEVAGILKQKPLKSFTIPAVMYENLEPGRRNEDGVMVLPADD